MTAWPVVLESQEPGSVSALVPVRAAAGWFDGHFPSQPILPGVAMLSLVEHALHTLVLPSIEPGAVLADLRRVRFRSMVSPQAQTLRVEIKKSTFAEHRYDFEVSSDGVLVCTGGCVVARPADPG